MTNENKNPVEIDDTELENANGGVLVGLLLPAVQKVQAAPVAPPQTGAGPHVKVFDGTTGGTR